LSGTVNIQNPTSNLAGTVASLPSSLRQAQSLQTGRCAALYGETSSSFIVAGRDTVPTEPGGWMLASLDAGAGLEARGTGEGLARSSGSSSSFGTLGPKNEINQTNQIDQTDQTNLPPVLSLRRLNPAGFLTNHFAEREAGGCRS
jgi:hypothetical protein